jgi:hypothetical protein
MFQAVLRDMVISQNVPLLRLRNLNLEAARRKVIERARLLERESYKAMMRRRRRLQASKDTFF